MAAARCLTAHYARRQTRRGPLRAGLDALVGLAFKAWIPWRAAKVQKATLDPTKISGRCGRLMCCLRYEDQTYEELRKKLQEDKRKLDTFNQDVARAEGEVRKQAASIKR